MQTQSLTPPLINRTEKARRSDRRFFRRLMVVLAIGMVLGGGALGFWPEAFDVATEEARKVGSLLILAGMADTLVLYFWDRIFPV